MTKVNKQFGEKTLELFALMEGTENWPQYVTKKTAEIITVLKETQSMLETQQFFANENGEEMKYTTVRSHILKAIDRIGNKKTDFRRGGKSELAQELFDLMDNTPDWEDYVTNYESELAKKFKKVRNFYELGRELNMAPGNIAGTLYGTTQKLGVIAKIKEGIPQTNRRDYTVLEQDQNIEDLNAQL